MTDNYTRDLEKENERLRALLDGVSVALEIAGAPVSNNGEISSHPERVRWLDAQARSLASRLLEARDIAKRMERERDEAREERDAARREWGNWTVACEKAEAERDAEKADRERAEKETLEQCAISMRETQRADRAESARDAARDNADSAVQKQLEALVLVEQFRARCERAEAVVEAARVVNSDQVGRKAFDVLDERLAAYDAARKT